jgi:hypothetical protein
MQREPQGISGQCPHGDPTCPCPDGDWCHYEDDPATGTKAMRCPTPGHCDAGISEQDRQRWHELADAEESVRELSRELAELRAKIAALCEPSPSERRARAINGLLFPKLVRADDVLAALAAPTGLEER